MLPLPLILLTAAITLVAGVVQGATGFGFVIVAAPVVAIYMAPSLAVPVLVVNGFVLCGVLLSRVYRDAHPRRIAILALFGMVSVPFGTALLVVLNATALKVLLGTVVGATAIAMLTGLRRTAKNEYIASVPVGIASGLLTGATGIAGAPVILFFANQGVEPRQFRANITLFLFVVNLSALPAFFVGGVLTMDVLETALAVLPTSVAGLFGGIWLAHRLSTATFRRLTLIVVLVAAVGAIVSGMIGGR